MARTTKAHEERRAEFLEAARELFYRHGYSDTSVAVIIDHIGVSKGTFYHYFKSKEDLLDQMVEQSTSEAATILQSILDETDTTALDQFNQLFRRATHWKAEHKDLIMMMMHALYRDENLLLRHKMFKRSVAATTPTLAEIIRRGMAEGTMQTRYPDETAEWIMELGIILNEKVAGIILAGEGQPQTYQQVELWFTVYERKVEKMIGAKDGSLEIFDRSELREFLS